MKRVLGTKFGCSVCARQKTEYVPPKTTGKRFKYKDYTQGDVTVKVQGYEPQALDWIFNKFPSLILNKSLFVETSGKVPVVKYKVGNRNRTYFPDMYLPKQKRIIEVKSPYTLGALTGRRWKKTQSKAQACIDQGYKFTLLLMNAKGERLWIPKDWYALSRKDVLAQVAYHYGDHMKDE